MEYLEIVTKLGDRIAYHGERFLLSCDSEHAGTHEPIHATNVRERKISAVIDVDVQVQVVWRWRRAPVTAGSRPDPCRARGAKGPAS